MSLNAAARLLEEAIALDTKSVDAPFTLGCLMTDQGILLAPLNSLKKAFD